MPIRCPSLTQRRINTFSDQLVSLSGGRLVNPYSVSRQVRDLFEVHCNLPGHLLRLKHTERRSVVTGASHFRRIPYIDLLGSSYWLAGLVRSSPGCADVERWSPVRVLGGEDMPASFATGHQDAAIRSFGYRSACCQPTDRYGCQQSVAVVQHTWDQELPARVTSNGYAHTDWMPGAGISFHEIPRGQVQCWIGLCNLVFGRGTSSHVPRRLSRP
jgi:hypothetical protein